MSLLSSLKKTASGLVATFKDGSQQRVQNMPIEVDLAITATNIVAANSFLKAIFYQTDKGNWRAVLNGTVTVSVAAASIVVTVTGITFGNVPGTGLYTALAAVGGGTAVKEVTANENASTITAAFVGSTNTTMSFTGDVPLASKPTVIP